MLVLNLLCLMYLFYVFHICTLPILRLLCLCYAYYVCAMPTTSFFVYYACAMLTTGQSSFPISSGVPDLDTFARSPNFAQNFHFAKKTLFSFKAILYHFRETHICIPFRYVHCIVKNVNFVFYYLNPDARCSFAALVVSLLLQFTRQIETESTKM